MLFTYVSGGPVWIRVIPGKKRLVIGTWLHLRPRHWTLAIKTMARRRRSLYRKVVRLRIVTTIKEHEQLSTEIKREIRREQRRLRRDEKGQITEEPMRRKAQTIKSDRRQRKRTIDPEKRRGRQVTPSQFTRYLKQSLQVIKK